MPQRRFRLLSLSLTLCLAACLEIDKGDDDEGDVDDGDTGISLGGDEDDDTDDTDDTDGEFDEDEDEDEDEDDGPVEFVALYSAFSGRISPSGGGYSFDPATVDGTEVAAYFYVALASEDWDGDFQNNETACILYFMPDASNTEVVAFSSADQEPSAAWAGFVMDGSAYYADSGGACADADVDAYATGITWGFGFSALDSELAAYFADNWDEYDTYANSMVGGWVQLDANDGAVAYNMNYGFAYELDGGEFVLNDADEYVFWDVTGWSDIESDTYFQISPGYAFGL